MNLQVGVKVLIENENGEWLFITRAQNLDGMWDIPGGRINPDEALYDALAREVMEETGMTLSAEPKLVAAQDIFVHEKDLHVVRLTFVGSASGGVKLSAEHSAHKWVEPTKVGLIENLDPYVVDAIRGL